MPDTGPDASDRAADALWAAAVFALDPTSVGGVYVRTDNSTASQAWLRFVQTLRPAGSPWRRLPTHIQSDRLIGGLDLAATLAAGRPIVARGLLAEADGGVIVLPIAERVPVATVAQLVAASENGEVALERDGFAQRHPSRFGVIALDEGQGDERAPSLLRERLALHLDAPAFHDDGAAEDWCRRIASARQLVALVTVPAASYEAICTAALALGIASLTAPLQVVRVARCVAALREKSQVDGDDLAVAARLVLGPRATTIPAPDQTDAAAQDVEQQEAPPHDGSQDTPTTLTDLVVDAARATLPPGLLAALAGKAGGGTAPRGSGQGGQKRASTRHGRPVGARRGKPDAGARLDLIETLRAAAPWQRLRRGHQGNARVEVRASDFRIRRFKKQPGNTTIFVVDASGSTALHRLAEAKGAIELLLGDCYVRRDEVAMVAFSGRGGEILLPPTRSPARARRRLAELPGGGGTPLAAGLDAAAALADAATRRGQTAGIVLLTDGKANLSRTGKAGRALAEADAHDAARALRARAVACIVVDTSPRPQAPALRLAETLGARYLPLPNADATTLSLAAKTQMARRAV